MAEVTCPNCGCSLEVTLEKASETPDLVPGEGLPGHERSTLSGADWRAISQGYRRTPPEGYTRPRGGQEQG